VVPCEGFRPGILARACVTARPADSHEVRCLSEYCSATGSWVIGFPTSASSSSFPTEARGFYRPPSSLYLRKAVHPLLGFRPLQSASDSFRPTGSACASPVAFLGVALPSSRYQPPAALRKASQSHPLSVLDVSHVLDGLLRLRPRGFVSPHNHVQGFSLQGFIPPTQPSRLVDVSCPLVVVPVPLPVVSPRRRFPGPRPQGFRPRGNPLSLSWRLSRRLGAIPSWLLFSSSRFSLFRP
jgi:hypothetical protein